MSLVSAGKARSGDASRNELEASALRVAIAVVVIAYVSWYFSRRMPSWTEADRVVMSFLVAWALVAVGFFAVTWIWPAPNACRRVLGIVLDVGTLTAALYHLGAFGSVVVSAYLFIIFINGFRFGRRYLHIAQFASVVGLLLLVGYVPWWNANHFVYFGWFMTLIIIPTYVGLMAERLDAARVKAEEALKELIEKQPRLS